MDAAIREAALVRRVRPGRPRGRDRWRRRILPIERHALELMSRVKERSGTAPGEIAPRVLGQSPDASVDGFALVAFRKARVMVTVAGEHEAKIVSLALSLAGR